MPAVFGTSVNEFLLEQPTTARGNCAGCGAKLPEGMVRYRYELCTPCLTPGRFVNQAADAVKKRSFKAKAKRR